MRVALGLVLTFIATPLIYLIVRTLEKPLPEIWEFLFRAKTLEAINTSALLVIIVVTVNVLVAALITVGIYLTDLPFSKFLLIPLTLPLAIPSYVFTYSWLAINSNLSGIWAAAFILVLTTLPYPLLSISISLQKIDAGVVEVARTLGLTKSQVLFRVILPQIRGGIGAGALLSGLYALSDFGAVSLLNVETLTVSVQNIYRSTYDRSVAASVALVLIFLSLLFVLAGERFKSPEAGKLVESRIDMKDFKESKILTKALLLLIVTTYIFLAVIIPVYILISRFLGNPQSIDLVNLVSASFNTVSVSLIGALLALIISTPIALVISQRVAGVAKFTERFVIVSHALPGVVIGLALVSIGSKIGFLYQTILLLGLAYALLFLPKSVAASAHALQRVPDSLTEVAKTLGKNRNQITREVTLPIAAPSIALGALLVFLTAMKELPATLMLRPTGFETLATEIWGYASINKFNEAAPYALFLILIATIPTFILSLKSEDAQSEKRSNLNGATSSDREVVNQ